jgi:hypothetical protein
MRRFIGECFVFLFGFIGGCGGGFCESENVLTIVL